MPTTRGRNQLEHASGTMPRRAKTKPIFAPSAARRTSIGSVIVDADADRGPVDRGDHRLRRLEDAQRELRRRRRAARRRSRALAVAPVERLAAARQVGARAEAAARAGDDHRAHVVVGVGRVERGDQLAAHRRREGVQPVGPVQREREDAVGDLVADLFEVHGPDATLRAWPRSR